jgi:hypothetical protein
MPQEKKTQPQCKSTNEGNEYWCDCVEKCGGIPCKLSRTKWYKHNPQTKETAEKAQHQRAVQAEIQLDREVSRQLRKERARVSKKGKGKGVEAAPVHVSEVISRLMSLSPVLTLPSLTQN